MTVPKISQHNFLHDISATVKQQIKALKCNKKQSIQKNSYFQIMINIAYRQKNLYSANITEKKNL